MAESPITLANERMGIIDACNHIGMGVSGGYSGKLYCPFGELFHADGGVSKAFRIYEDSAYCFAESMYFTPVRLIARDRGISDLDAAEYILDVTGYVAPDIDSQWAAVTNTEEVVNTDYLAEALKIYCQRICPDWEVRQFTESTSKKLTKCLELTDRVRTKDEVTQWLAVTKQVMAYELLGDTTHVSTV